MCGICGVLEFDRGRSVSESHLRAMTETLVHRGPDDAGVYIRGPVGLAMRRLSIIDLDTGRQPISNEDGTVWIVFNGEIYNYRELRPDLEKQGHVFHTVSDTETIVHLYEEYGDDCVHHLNGMFAFAIWDERRQRLLLARDRIGIKPLYYYYDSERLVFGSELKAIIAHSDVPHALDMVGLDLYVSFRYIPAPYTIFKGIRKLPAGHTLTCEDGAVTKKAYWDISFQPSSNGQSKDDLTDELLALLTDAARIRLHADVPLGAFLSGGVDSSAIVGLMSRLSDQPVHTFSIGFKEAYYNELEYARIVSDRYHTDHHEFILEPDAIRLLDTYAWHFDEPFADPAALPTLLLSRMTREHVTVALSGDGGDEVFAGYNRYWTEWAARYYGYIPRFIRESIILPATQFLYRNVSSEHRLKSYAGDAARRTQIQSLPVQERYALQFSAFTPDIKAALYADDLRNQLAPQPHDAYQTHFEHSRAYHWLSRAQYVDIKTWLPEQMLTKVDRTSMAYGLEARVPLLDHRIVEFMARLPAGYLMSWRELKGFFKQTVKDVVPDAIVNRSKHGFQVPLDTWFRGNLQEFVQDNLAPARIKRHGLWDEGVVSGLLVQHQRGEANNEGALFALLVFQMWWDRFGTKLG